MCLLPDVSALAAALRRMSAQQVTQPAQFAPCKVLDLAVCWSPSSRPACPNAVWSQVDDVVAVMDEALRPAACGIAAKLRAAGRSVELLLEGKKMKAVFKAAERCNAQRLLLVGGEEWGRGAVAVKDLTSRQQSEVPVEQLV